MAKEQAETPERSKRAFAPRLGQAPRPLDPGAKAGKDLFIEYRRRDSLRASINDQAN